ncbi:MAG: DUF493 domain-containing protein [Epsilonproteobacteria bacterium]|nr:DUF493 domain-containing protein [Campylobacterota bacterium]
MILDENSNQKPKIEYPCSWGFKLIGRDRDVIKGVIREIISDREYKNRDGHSSKSGKFVTVNTSCIVKSKEDRDRIFKSFQDSEYIDIVI